MVPTKAKKMDSPLRTFSLSDVFGTKRPLCRSNRSAINDASRKMVVIMHPATNSGLSSDAPTSEIYAIVWLSSSDEYRLSCVSTTQCRKRPRSVPSQTSPEIIGNILAASVMLDQTLLCWDA